MSQSPRCSGNPSGPAVPPVSTTQAYTSCATRHWRTNSCACQWAGLDQALPSGSPIVGSRASPYRRYCGQHTYVQSPVSLTTTADDACNVKVSNEDACLFRCMTIKANHKALKELSKFGSVPKKKKSTAKSSSLCIHALALRCTRSVCLQCGRNRCTLSSASKISPMECGHPGFPVLVVSKNSQEVVKTGRKSRTQYSLLFVRIQICAFSSTCEMSLMRSPWSSLLTRCQTVFWRWSPVRRNS